MIGDILAGLPAWNDGAGGAKALTTSYVAGETLPAEPRANVVRLWLDMGGTVTTSVEIELVPGSRGASSVDADHEPMRFLDGIKAGVATFSPGVISVLAPPTGKVTPVDVPIVPGYAYKVLAKRTGGAADSEMLLTADYIY